MTARGIEVGHDHYFGEVLRPMKALVTGPDGKDAPIHGGSYGVGVSRLVAGIIEASHDEAGIIWPDSVAPFGVAVVNLRPGTAEVDAVAEQAYKALAELGKEPLLDDRDDRPGAKFASSTWWVSPGSASSFAGRRRWRRWRSAATGERQTRWMQL